MIFSNCDRRFWCGECEHCQRQNSIEPFHPQMRYPWKMVCSNRVPRCCFFRAMIASVHVSTLFALTQTTSLNIVTIIIPNLFCNPGPGLLNMDLDCMLCSYRNQASSDLHGQLQKKNRRGRVIAAMLAAECFFFDARSFQDNSANGSRAFDSQFRD